MSADALEPDPEDLVRLLAEIQTLARFVPSPTMAESGSWMKTIGSR
jgi:hypothetical protein